jgi:hypothetical protein
MNSTEEIKYNPKCQFCKELFYAGFYIFTDAAKRKSIRQRIICDRCSSNPPRSFEYDYLVAQLAAEELLKS